MQPGAVVEGLLVEAVGSTRDGVGRATVRGPDGALGELLWVVGADPALRHRFLAGHRALAARAAPGLLPVRAVFDRPDLAAVHRAPTLDLPLERLAAPLPESSAAAIGAALAPALPSVSEVLGDLRVEDLAADLDGAPVVAPRLGRPRRTAGAAHRDLAGLLYRWWTGRTPPPGPRPPAPADLDPRVQVALDALDAGDLDRATAALAAVGGGPTDLRPLLAAHPAGIAVRTTRAPAAWSDEGGAAAPWRAVGWTAAVALWTASALAALTIVLVPLALLGAVAGTAAGALGEAMARRSALPRPVTPRPLPDRARGGRLAEGWAAVDTTRVRLAAARLPPLVEADVRAVIGRWESELDDLASAPAGILETRAPAVQRAVTDEARRMVSLLGRLATDDESALSDLARWVHRDAP